MIISGKSKLFENGKMHLPDLSNIIVKDLREYGVEQAGAYKGGVEAYKGMLNKIRSGSILSEQDAIELIPKTEETKRRIQKQIDSLLEKYYELKSRIDEIHNSRDITKGLVPLKQTEINLLKNQLDEIENSESLIHGPKYNTFSWGTIRIFTFLIVCYFVLPPVFLHERGRFCAEWS